MKTREYFDNLKKVKPVIHNTEFIKKDIKMKSKAIIEEEKGEDMFFYTIAAVLGLMFLFSNVTGFMTVNLSFYNKVTVNIFTMVLNSAVLVSIVLAAFLKAVNK